MHIITVTAIVAATIRSDDLAKLNQKAAAQGRAARSSADIVEAAIADALKYHEVVDSVEVSITRVDTKG